MTSLIGVYGAAGCGRGILPLLRVEYPQTEIVFIDDGLSPGSANNHDIVSWPDFVSRDVPDKSVCIAISDVFTRQKLANKCDATGIPLVEARSGFVVEMDGVVLGDGACLSPYVVLTSNIKIGRCFHANLQSYVEHDCILGDFVTLAPGAKVNGNVTIGDHVYIGSGAIIRQGVNIGSGAIVGMGAVVTRDVAPDTTVVGNPAKPLYKD